MKIKQPKLLTLITTYKCTASCNNCCFNCNPNYGKMMTLSEMQEYISVSHELFPKISLVVFTGGECTLLKNDLISAIKFCANLGLITRIVSNGHWGTSVDDAIKYLDILTDNGLTELNLSTGKDHLEYVKLSNILNIMEAASQNKKIKGVVISVEKRNDYNLSALINTLKSKIISFTSKKKFFIIESPWVSFRRRDITFNDDTKMDEVEGCRNLFSGLQINPNGQLLSCCGLACEYTPILKLGRFNKITLVNNFNAQFNDILKLWLYTDGPLKILKKINKNVSPIKNGRHSCDYCMELLTNAENIKKLLDTTEREAKEIILKYVINIKTIPNERKL